ncbi:MAG: carbon-nitrogen hydrolase family protein [Deltaproteobacteria bacterium]|nr:carbon-nitrogen hydrolase family protein [Deltaproteobacteria bacterium]MBW2044410.1 carbon-nitrogen hydrolase family protein [Deltaproteobacteria bacterium]
MLLALAQMRPDLHNKKKNLEKILDMSAMAAKEGADFVAFPEMALTGYVCGKRFFEHSEPIDGASVKRVADQAKDKKISILFGMPELNGSLIHNSAVLVEPSGITGVYRKVYLVTFEFAGVRYEEHMYFKPGSNLMAFDTRFGKIGVEICYDLWFPEIVRSYCLQGAWLVLNISAAPFDVPSIFQLLGRSRAAENQSYFGYVNEVGPQEGVVFQGGSYITDNNAEVIKSASFGPEVQEEIIQIELDPEHITKARLDLPLLRDVRPEVLHKVADIAEDLYFPPRRSNK